MTKLTHPDHERERERELGFGSFLLRCTIVLSQRGEKNLAWELKYEAKMTGWLTVVQRFLVIIWQVSVKPFVDGRLQSKLSGSYCLPGTSSPPSPFPEISQFHVHFMPTLSDRQSDERENALITFSIKQRSLQVAWEEWRRRAVWFPCAGAAHVHRWLSQRFREQSCDGAGPESKEGWRCSAGY